VILAIDPGPTESAFVRYCPERRKPIRFDKLPNLEILDELAPIESFLGSPEQRRTTLVVEMIASYGMPVGREVFETCMWVGRFVQAWGGLHDLMYRSTVKLHLCNSARAKDGNVRQALIDAFGGSKALGNKKTPGPLYGVSGDVWAALAVAVTYADIQEQARLHEVIRNGVGDYTIQEQAGGAA
jgi:hypothetical protein